MQRLFRPFVRAPSLVSLARSGLGVCACVSGGRTLSSATGWMGLRHFGLARSTTPVKDRPLKLALPMRSFSRVSQHDTAASELHQLSLRLAHENNYLSWARNSIIATVASAGLNNYEPVAAACLLALGLSFNVIGCSQYLAQAYYYRKHFSLRPATLLWMSFHSLAAFTFWLLAVLAFLEEGPEVLYMVQDLLTVVSERRQVISEQKTERKRLSTMLEQLRKERRELQRRLDDLEHQWRCLDIWSWIIKGSRLERDIEDAKAKIAGYDELINVMLEGRLPVESSPTTTSAASSD